MPVTRLVFNTQPLTDAGKWCRIIPNDSNEAFTHTVNFETKIPHRFTLVNDEVVDKYPNLSDSEVVAADNAAAEAREAADLADQAANAAAAAAQE
jgi:hypothetical protein